MKIRIFGGAAFQDFCFFLKSNVAQRLLEKAPWEGSSRGLLGKAPREGSLGRLLEKAPWEGSLRRLLGKVPREGSLGRLLERAPREGSSRRLNQNHRSLIFIIVILLGQIFRVQ